MFVCLFPGPAMVTNGGFAKSKVEKNHAMSQVLGWLANRDKHRIALNRIRHNGDGKLRRSWVIVQSCVLFNNRHVFTCSMKLAWGKTWISLVTEYMEKVLVTANEM